MTVTNKEIDPAFSERVAGTTGGEFLNRCYSCGACSGICPVSQAIPDFDPRKIIHMVRMGLKDRLLTSKVIWYCSSCRSCVFVCPQDVRFAEIVKVLWRMAWDEGIITEQNLRDMGKTAWVEPAGCVSCLTCVRVCPWEIPRINEEGVAEIDPHTCRACGICVAECPAQTIMLNQSEDEQLLAACAG